MSQDHSSPFQLGHPNGKAHSIMGRNGLHRDTGGTGIPLLFLHGTGCDDVDWAEAIAHLPPGLHIVTLEFRGHGQSDVPVKAFTLQDLASDLLQLADHINAENLLLVGHSLGGMVALEAASQSSRIVGLVLLEGWTSLAASRAFDEGRSYGGLSQKRIESILTKSQLTRDRFNSENWTAFWETVSAFDSYEYLKQTTIPVVETYGEIGRNEETKAGLRIPSNPMIETIWIPNAGHYLPHERPQEVAAACVRGVERINDIL
jgi:pimeloyl-ACP methyl ester carboxylesterase